MPESNIRVLDVRPILNAGGEPFGEIMNAVAALTPGQSLKLIATFKPVPLFAALQKQGFSHTEQPLGGGDWEVLFTPNSAAPAAPAAVAKPAAADDTTEVWPAPRQTLDNRGLLPPEPLVRILETIAEMAPGEVLEVWNDRDPVFLYPKLAERGHAIRATPQSGKGVYLLIRHGQATGDAQ